MMISSANVNNVNHKMAAPVISSTDTEAKSIQNQIASKQQNLNRLSSDAEMSDEEKVKERQEIQKQIAELNRKLRMLQMEKKEEMKESEKEQEQKADLIQNPAKEVIHDDKDEKVAEQKEKPAFSPVGIQKMLEAGALLQKEQIQQNTEHKKELSENVLSTEIKLDEMYGSDTSEKKEKLASMKQKSFFEYEIDEQQEEKKTANLFNENTKAKIIIREDGM